MLDLEAKFSPRIIPASTEYPYGELKPNTATASNDGTPVTAAVGNDIEGFKQAAITRANIDPSGIPDNAINSQLLDGLDKRYLEIDYQAWTFATGGLLVDCSQAVEHTNNKWYSWGGIFPEGGKVVSAGTDPTVDAGYVSRVTPFEHLPIVGASSADNTGTTYVQDLIFDTYGHVTGLVSTEIREGNTSQTGIVQLTDSTGSTSTTTAATPNSVKNAYDLASAAIPSTQKGAVGGVATLDGSGKVPTTQLPSAYEIGAVPLTRTVNSKPLSEDVTITASDVNATPSSHVGGTGTAHGVATTSVAGFMSSSDKDKIDNALLKNDNLAGLAAPDTALSNLGVSTFIKTLLDDADAVTARATLGAQASDATLAALAGVTTAADKLIYATAHDVFTTTSITPFARTLIDDVDADAMRTTLGIDGLSVNDLRDELEPRISNNETVSEEALRRTYAEAGHDLIGRFSDTGLVVTTVTDVVLWEPTGIAYAYGGGLPHTIGAGETPVGNPSWVAKSTKTSRTDLTDNTSLLSEAHAKLRAGTAKVVCVGDSITYGHDTFSAGTVPPVSPHTQPRVTTPYPEQMIASLNLAYGVGNSVINRGYSGDTVKMSYNRWTTDPVANLAIIAFGINDAISGGVGISVAEYEDYLARTVTRYIRWGCGVVVSLSSLMAKGIESRPVEKYRAAAKRVADKYFCPVFDGSEIGLQNFDSEIQSDTVHFNQAGYSLFGNSVASFILAGGLLCIEHVISEETTHSVGYAGRTVTTGTITEGSGALTVQELIAQLTKGTAQRITYSFYLDADAAELYVIGQIPKGCTISFDFGGVRGRSTRKIINAVTTSDYAVASDTVRNTGSSRVFLGRVIGRGWHSVSISAPSADAAQAAYISAFTISPVSVEACMPTVWHCHERVFSIFDPQPTLQNLPAASALATFAVPAYLFGSLLYRGPGYFAHNFATIEIRSFSAGWHAYTKTVVTLSLDGTVKLLPMLAESTGENPVTVTSITGATLEGATGGGDLTINLNRPLAGYIEIRIRVADTPDIRAAYMPA